MTKPREKTYHPCPDCGELTALIHQCKVCIEIGKERVTVTEVERAAMEYAARVEPEEIRHLEIQEVIYEESTRGWMMRRGTYVNR